MADSPPETSHESQAAAVLASRLERPPARGIDVITTLQHFALVSYFVPIEKLRAVVDPAFRIATFETPNGPRGLLSVVPFLDRDFRFANLPWLRFSFGQTNYRIYVEDQDRSPLAWFLGTSLATVFVAVPRLAWGLPWHHARMRWTTEYDATRRRYSRYSLATASSWAEAELELEDSGTPAPLLSGFRTPEEQRLVLTHPVTGVYYRHNGSIGTYSIWHPPLELTEGRALKARFGLLSRLGLLSDEEMAHPHSVLICPSIEFQIRLPPKPYL